MTTTPAPTDANPTDANPPDTNPARRTRRQVVSFLALTFALSWSAWFVAVALGADTLSGVGFVCFAIGGFAPSLVALAHRLRGVRSPRMARRESIKRWLPTAILCGAAPAVMAALVTPLFGAPALVGTEPGTTVANGGGLLVFLITSVLAGPISEEFGWRGFLQPRLRTRFSPAVTALILGSIWALWHTPLFLLVGPFQSTLGPLGGLCFLLTMVPMSMTFWFVSERLHGGVPAAVAIHALGNMGVLLLPFTSPASSVVHLATAAAIGLAVFLAPGSRARTAEVLAPLANTR